MLKVQDTCTALLQRRKNMDERKDEEQKHSSTLNEGQQTQQPYSAQGYNSQLTQQGNWAQTPPQNFAGNTQQYYAQPTQQNMYGGYTNIPPQYQNGAYYNAAPAQITEAQKQAQKDAELLNSIERFGFGEVWKKERPNEYSMYSKIKILQYALIAIGIILGAIAVICFFSWQNSDDLEKLLDYKDTKNTVNALIISCACIVFIGASIIPEDYKMTKINNFVYEINLDYKNILIRGYNAKLNSTQFKEIKKYAYLQHKGKLNKSNIFMDYCLNIVLYAVIAAFIGYVAYDYVNTEMQNWLIDVESTPTDTDESKIYILLIVFILIIIILFIGVLFISKSRDKKIDKWVESLM